MRILLPDQLTIEDIHMEGVETIQNYSETKMLRFLNLFQEICRKGLYFKGKSKVEIYSKKLQRISRDYVQYLALLKQLSVLQINPYYMPGEQCKMYSYTPLCAKTYFLHKINTRRRIFINDVINYRDNNNDVDRLIFKLNEFFSFLNFDTEGALILADQLKEKRKVNPDIDYTARGWIKTITDKWYKGIKPKPKDLEEQYKYELWQIDKWDDQFFGGFRDKTGNRFHSLLSGLPKDFKKFITFGSNEEKLFSLDIKNSQPFFSLILMDPAFWYHPEMPEDYKKKYVRHFSEPVNPSTINIHTIGMQNCFPLRIYSYIVKALSLLGSDYDVYKESVLTGALYGKMLEQYKAKLNIVSMGRDEVKTSLFTTIFSSNKFMGQRDAALKKLFSKTFPTVYKVIAAIKRENRKFDGKGLTDKPHKLFSIMLQRIESFTVLDVVAKCIIDEYKNIPVYTIHDSVCSTERYMPEIETIFKSKIQDYTGLIPSFELQQW